MENSKENIMGTMKEGRLLFKLALPMIFSVLVSSLYNIIDSIFVGTIGQDALTAISLGAPASSLMVELSFGVAIGVNALLSRKLGKKDSEGGRARLFADRHCLSDFSRVRIVRRESVLSGSDK